MTGASEQNKGAKESRERRLAEALRANLKRRKAPHQGSSPQSTTLSAVADETATDGDEGRLVPSEASGKSPT